MSDQTVGRDINATFVAPPRENPSETAESDNVIATNVAPAKLSGADAAQAVAKVVGREAKEADIKEKRAEFGQRGRVAYAVNPRLWEAAE